MDADAAFITIKDEKTNQNHILDSINIQIDENAFGNCFAEKLLYEKIDEEKGKTIVIKKDLLESRER